MEWMEQLGSCIHEEDGYVTEGGRENEVDGGGGGLSL